MKRLTATEVQAIKDQGVEFELLPMKAVATVKPPGKKKGRVDSVRQLCRREV